MAELVDALVSGTSKRKFVQVRVLFRALKTVERLSFFVSGIFSNFAVGRNIAMEINLFSKCVRELIVDNDRVAVPHLGVFSAEMMPASYSDRQTTIHPPYRKMQFHKEDVSLEDGRLLLDKIVAETGVSGEQAGVELGWCLSRLCSELEGRKSCRLPGLGTMRANARNEFFFVPDDDLDIWPDGIGFEPISIKVSEKTVRPDVPEAEPEPEPLAEEEPVSEDALPAEPRTEFESEPQTEFEPESQPEAAAEIAPEPEIETETETETDIESEPGIEAEPETGATPAYEADPFRFSRSESWNRPSDPSEMSYWRLRQILRIAAIVAGILLVLFIIASYVFTEEMSPILDRLLYTKEELKLLGR